MNQHHPQQWYKVVVSHAIEWEDGPDGGAVLLVPRFRWGPFARWLQPRLKNKHMRVKLDEIGSFVWRQFDGRKSFADVVAAMESHFGQRADPAPDRLQRFLTVLYKDKFIGLYAPTK